MWPQVAAACKGVHSSLSLAFTFAPWESSSLTISSKLSMQHWEGHRGRVRSGMARALVGAHLTHSPQEIPRRTAETEPEFESSCMASVLEVLPGTLGEALYLLEKLIMRKIKIASANGPVSYKVFL